MVKALGISVEALTGTETAKRKAKAVNTRMQQIASLPPGEWRQMQLSDAFVERGQLKRRSSQATSG